MSDYWKEVWGWIWPPLAIAIVIMFLVVYIAQPKCDACMHFAHKKEICGAWMKYGKCVCREDK